MRLRPPAGVSLHLRRSFFSAPSFSPFNNDVQRYSERKIFPYHEKQLFEIVANVSQYPRFIPFCTECRILSSPNEGRHGVDPYTMEVELTAGFMSFTESYVSKVTCIPFKSVEAVATSSTPLFKNLSTIWRFQPVSPNTQHPLPPSNVRGSNPTLVTFDLVYAFSNPIHAAVSSAFFGQISKQTIAAFEKRCIEVYGRGSR
ncbi:coenzyme q-binding protein coq10-like protein mitochondrial-like protein [Moniliophthora roreri MCA 2997]|uniref:Coenzyme q-binding protein coq10-like protein mitochondrial-like protein n=2 Tax=Moniliophthora roreri TaxID=221103 RepID=V2XYN0_MONRO|nr:coenzyme q-binding protein coq10-like protein mitochondrial-like protein [Moniliophthora roreri MCA 2997]KAI3612546.1 coenzyme q-binding protein coq10-like protein mitochondrial-like protein [Moniliophthora roreri]